MTKKVAVAVKDSKGLEIHEVQEFNKGDEFSIVTEATDLNSLLVLSRVERNGDLDKATIVDFGDGYMVFFDEEDEQAYGFYDYFEIKEVA